MELVTFIEQGASLPGICPWALSAEQGKCCAATASPGGDAAASDAFEAPKFDVPGHWATGQRAERNKTRGAGKTVVIGVVDDQTRLAYCELHSAENAANVSACLRRAASWFREQGCGPVQAGQRSAHGRICHRSSGSKTTDGHTHRQRPAITRVHPVREQNT